MLRTSLTDAQRSELNAFRRTDLPAVARDRVEMVLMSADGWSPPKIAAHLGRHPHTVRAALHGYAARGTEALYPDTPGPEPDLVRRAEVTGKRTALLGQDRTWTSRQLADHFRGRRLPCRDVARRTPEPARWPRSPRRR